MMEGGPQKERGSQKKTNGAANGFLGEIDWERYTHFFSSDESEEEEDPRKKFKIKIKPLPADCPVTAPSVDQLKASIGHITLSPSPMVSSAAPAGYRRPASVFFIWTFI
ncbi:hypothetical protein CRUP_011519 [Coryphaenoides rupestris]|nr:hypothetical protein CRUP_011519 [Coryphaenoides rupestris]